MCQCQVSERGESCGGCQRSGCSCCKCSCCQPDRQSSCKGHENWTAKLLEVADEAWMEVLKEKIKERIRAEGHHLDELAKLLADGNHERWKKKVDAKCSCRSLDDKLKDFFAKSCSVSQKTK